MRQKVQGYEKPWAVGVKQPFYQDVRRCVSSALSGSEEKIDPRPSPCREEEEGEGDSTYDARGL